MRGLADTLGRYPLDKIRGTAQSMTGRRSRQARCVEPSGIVGGQFSVGFFDFEMLENRQIVIEIFCNERQRIAQRLGQAFALLRAQRVQEITHPARV